MSTPRRIDQIAPGYYRYRLVRGGPLMPAQVTIEGTMAYVVVGDGSLRASVDTARYADMVIDAVMNGEAFEEPILRCLWFGEPITQREHAYQLSVLAWARANHPDHPLCHPERPVRMGETPVAAIF